MKKELEFLKRRAGKFHSYAVVAFKNGDYEIAAFNIEQALQLYLKYTLGVLLGDFPKTHSISRLLENVSKASGVKSFLAFIEKEPNIVSNLEEVYLTARYLPAEFTKNQVANLISFAEKVIGKLKPLWN
ncbi:MAG: HEPN domain-containing protein [Endomicrobiia bacterium]|nr:HEPN domain-containing protein [Endomicrobiia bacterium]